MSLVLALCLSGPAAGPGSTLSTTAHVVVEGEGRVLLLDEHGAAFAPARGEAVPLAPAGTLEAGAAAELRFTFPGRASLSVSGPASISWAEAADGRLALDLAPVRAAHVEVRRGLVDLGLPGDWRVELAGGTLFCAGLSDGSLRLARDAGETAFLRWLGDERRARPPVPCRPGETLRLRAGEALPGPPDWTSRARPWERAAWAWPHWSSGESTPGEDSAASVLTFTERTAPPLPPEEPAVEAVVEPLGVEATEPAAPAPGPAPLAEFAAPPAPVVPPAHEPEAASVPDLPVVEVEAEVGLAGESAVAAPAPVPAPLRRPAAKGYDPALWRGLARERVRIVGGFAVEEDEAVRIEELPGRFRVYLRADASAPRWVFGPRKDLVLRPGAVALLFADGGLQAHYGGVTLHDAPPNRPRLDAQP